MRCSGKILSASSSLPPKTLTGTWIYKSKWIHKYNKLKLMSCIAKWVLLLNSIIRDWNWLHPLTKLESRLRLWVWLMFAFWTMCGEILMRLGLTSIITWLIFWKLSCIWQKLITHLYRISAFFSILSLTASPFTPAQKKIFWSNWS